MEEEHWKDIEGYEGLYQISDLGRVKSLKYGRETLLNPYRNNKGYLGVSLHKDKIRKTPKVHRLVAQAFLPNPENLLEINHIDEDKTNNRVDNLEWCDRKYNVNYGKRTEKCSKRVQQFTIDGHLVAEWKSIHDAARNNGFNFSHISECCNGGFWCNGKWINNYVYKGYKWKFA